MMLAFHRRRVDGNDEVVVQSKGIGNFVGSKFQS